MKNYKLKLFKGAMQLLLILACVVVIGITAVEVL